MKALKRICLVWMIAFIAAIVKTSNTEWIDNPVVLLIGFLTSGLLWGILDIWGTSDMDEYIKKDDVLNLLRKNSITKKITFADGVSIYDSVKNIPTVDVAPRKGNDVPRYIKLPQPEYLPPTAEELEQFAANLYQSPIEIIMQEMHTQFDDEVFKATQTYGINVDKNELIKALEYDRDQYNKGFADGSRIDTTAIRAEVAREIFEEIEELFRQHKEGGYYLDGTWFPERLDLYTEDAFAELKNKYAEVQK